MKPTVVFIVDAPGWALDSMFKRLIPNFASINAKIYYLSKSLKDCLAQRYTHEPLPPADFYIFTSWYYCHILNVLKIQYPKDNYGVCVVDRYNHKDYNMRFMWSEISDQAKLIFDQTAELDTSNAKVSHIVNPTSVDFLNDHHQKERQDNLVVGMIANGFNHSRDTKDFKGVHLAHEAISQLSGIQLKIAGTDEIIPIDKMKDWYQSIDVFLTLSISECFSAAIADALALGVPVIGTPVGPLEPFVGDRGYIKVSRDVEVLKKALIDMRDNKTKDIDRLQYAREVAATWEASKATKEMEADILSVLGEVV